MLVALIERELQPESFTGFLTLLYLAPSLYRASQFFLKERTEEERLSCVALFSLLRDDPYIPKHFNFVSHFLSYVCRLPADKHKGTIRGVWIRIRWLDSLSNQCHFVEPIAVYLDEIMAAPGGSNQFELSTIRPNMTFGTLQTSHRSRIYDRHRLELQSQNALSTATLDCLKTCWVLRTDVNKAAGELSIPGRRKRCARWCELGSRGG